jgi:hypothetical protein
MQNTRIIYLAKDGLVIVTPAPSSGRTVEQIALKDVPFGTSYKVVDVSDLPSALLFMEAWEIDPALLNDGVGADYGTGSTNTVIGWNLDGTPVLRDES